MINLLPDEYKQEIKAARTNTTLIRYTGLIFIAIAFLLSYLFVSYAVLQNTMVSADELISNNDVKADVYSGTKQQVDTLSAQLSGAKSMFQQEVKYSQVLVKLGKQMPAGTIIENLELTNQSFNGMPVTIKAYAKSTEEATQLQSSLQSSPLLSRVSLESTGNNGIEGYPVDVVLSVVFLRTGL